MSILEKIKNDLARELSRAAGVEIAAAELVAPPQSEMGDLSLPCFRLAKTLKKAPEKIAEELAERVRQSVSHLERSVSGVERSPRTEKRDSSTPLGMTLTRRFIENAVATGPYLNFYFNTGALAAELFKEILHPKPYTLHPKKRVMIEYSQPNTHKEFHVGHLRGTVLGAAIANLYKVSGYQVLGVNYIGDIGAHVAKCLWALQKFHQGDKPPADKGQYLGHLYAEATRLAEESVTVKEEVSKLQQALEAGDPKLLKLWKKTRGWSLASFKKIYQILSVKFDHYFFESEVEKEGKKMAAELLAKGLAQKSQGAVMMDLRQYNLDVFLILKSDGTTLYATKDLALAKKKFAKYKIDQSIVITDSRQSFYFQQLFKTLEIIGFQKPMRHIAYEFVTLPAGAMSSRHGNVVLFSDILAQAQAKLETETKTRHPDWPASKIKKTAAALALAGLKFDMLKIQPAQIITFDLNQALSFEGFTGPYLEYSLARINSIFKKSQIPNPKSQILGLDFSLLETPVEKKLIIKLAHFAEIITMAWERHDPSHLAKYLYELAKVFSEFYEHCPIIKAANPALARARLDLVKVAQVILERGLAVLGLPVVKEM